MSSSTSSNDGREPVPGNVSEPVFIEPSIPAPDAAEPSLPPLDLSDSSIPPLTPYEPSPAPPAGEKQSGSRGASGWALLLSLLALVGAALALWQAHTWRTGNKGIQEEVAKRLSGYDAAVTESRGFEQKLADTQNQIATLAERLDKSQGQAVALEQLYLKFSQTQEERIAVEVEQAIAIATQQLQYAGNVQMALIALRAALERLKQNDHGQLAPLRSAIEADIKKLSQEDWLDIPQTASRLEHVLEKIDALPLNWPGEVSVAEPPPVTEPPKESNGFAQILRGLAGEVWSDLRSLVRIERISAKSEPVLLAPEQSAFLRDNVKIRLLTARLAMLARDGHTYASDLKQARDWIERYFDMKNWNVSGVADELKELESLPVSVKRYELTESAAAVRRFLTPRGTQTPPAQNGASAPPAEAPQPSSPPQP
ncbi:MAG: uroporphyrinogen-III C-methyltransferase [Azoarcus sp.]|jgi:uroporphyrin-3 C-methyltransferase|nr:uroporphyrinogen-III C-methyltransferase [Azoarcus sp.]